MTFRRTWPWLTWAIAGLAIETVAVATGWWAPLTQVVGWVRHTWQGRLAYSAFAAMADCHFEEAH